MKSTIKNTQRPVKGPDASAFKQGLALLRNVYSDQVAALLEELRPRIEAGEFLDLGDGMEPVSYEEAAALPAGALKDSSQMADGMIDLCCGISLLMSAIHALPFARDLDVMRTVLSVSTHEYEGGDNAADTSECLAHDVRSAAKRQGVRVWRTRAPHRAALP